MSWDIENLHAGTHLAWLEETLSYTGVPDRSMLHQVSRGLDSWDRALADHRTARGDRDKPVPSTRWLEWAGSQLGATAHDAIAEALVGLNLDDYSEGTARPIECARKVAEQVTVAWRTVLTDLIEQRDQGQLGDAEQWQAAVEHYSDVIDMARNATRAQYL